jgi:hypothetical protein
VELDELDAEEAGLSLLVEALSLFLVSLFDSDFFESDDFEVSLLLASPFWPLRA